MFWSSFSSVVVWLCAAYADIVLFFCSLSRKSYTDLVEPLVTAAITLDPIYLYDKGCRKKCFFNFFWQFSLPGGRQTCFSAGLNYNFTYIYMSRQNKPRRPLALYTKVQHTVSSPPLNQKVRGQTLSVVQEKSSWFLHSSLCFS